MTRYIASIDNDMNINSKNPTAWRVSVFPETLDAPWTRPAGQWFQIVPVHNNSRTDRACFESRREALIAILDFIGTPCVIRDTQFGMEESLIVTGHGAKSPARVVASRSASGTFVQDR